MECIGSIDKEILSIFLLSADYQNLQLQEKIKKIKK